MKKILLFTFTLLLSISMHSQDISGKWNGVLKVSGQSLRIVFNITQAENGEGFQATMDSPDQGARGIPVNSITFEGNEVILNILAAGISYKGTLSKANYIEGTFTQGSFSTLMALEKVTTEEPALKRPQEPIPPFPYHSEDITFDNQEADITLAGTLTLPSKERKSPAVILISGSGPQNRNSEMMGHKPFLVLADYLTRNGIAVLRYDERGIGQSTGTYSGSTSYDFAKDVEAGVEYLKSRPEINTSQIGLIGHSEGGLIAPMVASKNKEISFIVLMAGPGLRGDQIMLKQKELIELQMGVSKVAVDHNQKIFAGAYDLIINHSGENLQEDLTNYFREKYGKGLQQDQLNALVAQLSNPWMVAFIKADPAKYLPKVSCPVLAINGSKDLQVPAKENLKEIEKNLKEGGNTKVMAKELKDLNHLFQECETGLPEEYGEIEQTISPGVLEAINTWIKELVK